MSDDLSATGSSVARVFGRAAETFGGMGNFSYFGERLVSHAQLNEGDRVLDVATGRGAVAFNAAKRVGKSGRVIGVDIAHEMLGETARTLASGEWPMIELQMMDAEQLDFPDASFDCVLCGFALWFFPHPERALHEFHRVLKPRGRSALSTLAHDSSYHKLLQDTLRPHLGPTAEAAREGKTARFDTRQELEAALRDAGFTGTRVVTEDYNTVAASSDAMWKHLWSTSHRRHLEQMPEATLDAVKADYFERLTEFTQHDGIHLVWRALIAVSEKAL